MDNNIASARILFVGGNENYLRKLKKLYPDWTYLDPSERNCNKVKRNFDAVVLKYDHISHNIVEKVVASCNKDTPIIYCSGTNINLSVSQIQEGYKKIFKTA